MTWTTCGGCGKSWDDAFVPEGSHVCPEAVPEEIDWRARALVAEADVARLTARIAELDAGISLRGWWCTSGICHAWNGEEYSKRDACRRCGEPKSVRSNEGGSG